MPLPAVLRVMLAGLLVLAASSCSGHEPEPDEDRVPMPELTPFSQEAVEKLHEIRDGVAELRELPVHPGVREDTLDRVALGEYYAQFRSEDGSEERKNTETWNRILRLMHVIEPAVDIEDSWTELYTMDVGGLYYPRDDALVLVEGDTQRVTLMDELVLAHEYAHSLQDHSLEFDDYDEKYFRSTEISTTMRCIEEGDAEVTAYEYMDDKYGMDWYEDAWDEYIEVEDDAEAMAEEEFAAREEEFDREAGRSYFERSMYFNYEDCYWFVYEVFDRRGWKGVNALYDDPPISTEQVLHPEKYFRREAPKHPDDVDLTSVLSDGWESDDPYIFGEFDIYNWLVSAGVDWETAYDAAEGWGGGRARAYSRAPDADSGEEQVLIHIALGFDSPKHLEEFGQGLYWMVTEAFGWRLNRSLVTTLRWGTEGEYAAADFDEKALTVDVVMSTDEAALADALGRLNPQLVKR